MPKDKKDKKSKENETKIKEKKEEKPSLDRTSSNEKQMHLKKKSSGGFGQIFKGRKNSARISTVSKFEPVGIESTENMNERDEILLDKNKKCCIIKENTIDNSQIESTLKYTDDEANNDEDDELTLVPVDTDLLSSGSNNKSKQDFSETNMDNNTDLNDETLNKSDDKFNKDACDSPVVYIGADTKDCDDHESFDTVEISSFNTSDFEEDSEEGVVRISKDELSESFGAYSFQNIDKSLQKVDSNKNNCENICSIDELNESVEVIGESIDAVGESIDAIGESIDAIGESKYEENESKEKISEFNKFENVVTGVENGSEIRLSIESANNVLESNLTIEESNNLKIPKKYSTKSEPVPSISANVAEQNESPSSRLNKHFSLDYSNLELRSFGLSEAIISQLHSKQSLVGKSRYKKSKNLSIMVKEPLAEIDSNIEQTSFLNDFINDEKYYMDCVSMCAEFESLVNHSVSANQKILSKHEVQKLSMFFNSLAVTYQEAKVMLFQTTDEDIGDFKLEAYFNQLSLTKPIYKEIALSYNKNKDILKKAKQTDNFKAAAYNIKLRDENKLYSIFDLMDEIVNRFFKYCSHLDKIIKACHPSTPEHNTYREILDQIIVFSDVMKLCLFDKKAPFSRKVTFCSPSVLLNGDKRKLCFVHLFMDTLVISMESSKNNSLVPKYITSVKNVVIDKCEDLPETSETCKENLDLLRGHVANCRDKLFNYTKNKANKAKYDKIQKLMFDYETKLALLSPRHHLRLFFGSKLNVSLLFSTQSMFDRWVYIIRNRNKTTLLDRSVPTVQEIQTLLNESAKKILDDEVDTEKFVETPLSIPYGQSLQDDAPDESLDYEFENTLNGSLCMRILCKRTELNSGGEYIFNAYCDNYGHFFDKYKSKVFKNELVDETILIKAEAMTSYELKVYKPKNKVESFKTEPENLIRDDILNRRYLSFRHPIESFGVFYVHTYFIEDEDNIPEFLTNFEHFQPSIDEIANAEMRNIPLVVDLCIQYIDKYASDSVGIYRLSGTNSEIAAIKNQFSQGLILEMDDLDGYDVNAVAGLLKMFFRDIKYRIVPIELVSTFISWFNSNDKTINTLRDNIDLLPLISKMTFYTLLDHLKRLQKKCEINKMNSANIATVFAPNIFAAEVNESGLDVNIFQMTSVFKDMLDVYE